MAIYCPKCGARNDDDMLVCRICGKSFKTGGNGALFYVPALVIVALLMLSAFPFIKPYVPYWQAKVDSLFVSRSANTTNTTNHASNTTNTTRIGPYQATDQITAVNLEVVYYNSSAGIYQNYTKTYPGFNITQGARFSYTISFSNTNADAYVINNIEATTSEFKIESITPALPYTLSPGSSLSVTVDMNSVNEPYTNTLNIIVMERSVAHASNSTTNSTTNSTAPTNTTQTNQTGSPNSIITI